MRPSRSSRAWKIGLKMQRNKRGPREDITFLIRVEGGEGRILKRYLGLEHASAAIAADLTALARNPSGS